MALVPAGPFVMGASAEVGLGECKKLYYKPDECSRDWFTNEEPAHEVTLAAFYIDQYEVTNAQYKQCVYAGACRRPPSNSSSTRDSYYGNSEYNNYPVISVSWDQAKTYCKWRGDRLPSEAEWEKAARGTDGRTYPWGNEFDGSRVNFCDSNCEFEWANKVYDDGYADTAPVGSYSNNGSPYGVYDMSGNVWEWVADWYDVHYYKNSPSENPLGPKDEENKSFKVLRGGGWDGYAFSARATARTGPYLDFQHGVVGFRCAADAP